jgi:hypothetical protein
VRELSTQSSAWLTSFVPRLWLALSDQVEKGTWSVLDTHGVVLVADIVSFTPLAIAHASQGRPGQATLSAVLDRCVALVAQETTLCGGEPVGFAGDAMFSLFTAADGSTAWDAARRCAGRILSAPPPVLADSAVRPPPRPMLRVGLAGGAVRLLCVRLETRSYVVMLGAPVIAAARTQAGARAGAMAVDPDHGPSFDLPPVGPLVDPAHQCGSEVIETLVPAPLMARGRAELSEWLAEIRPVTSLFAGLRRGESCLNEPEAIARAITVSDEVLRAHGSVIDRVVQDDKGTVFWATFGVFADEIADARADRAVGAGLALRSSLAREGVAVDVGIATGRAAVGAVGDSRRRVFTVAGPSVNLAARLMQSARGEILVDEATVRHCTMTAFSSAARLGLKGVSGDVTAYFASPRVDSSGSRRAGATAKSGEMIGRGEELAVLLRELEAIRRPGAARPPVALVGEPGVGKTTLLDAAIRHARERGIRTVSVACDAITRNSPFGALIGPSVVTSLMEQTGATFSLGAGRPEQVILDAAAASLSYTLGSAAAVLAVRDAHWIDEASLAVLEHVHRHRDRLLMILESRPGPAAQGEPVGDVLDRTNATRIRLDGLRADQVGMLVTRRLGVRAMSPDLVEALTRRTDGNPFFATQLAIALSELGYVVRRGDVAQLFRQPALDPSADIPTTIHDTLAGRIDKLDPNALLTLKVASVFGLTAEIDAIRAAHPVTGKEELLSALDRLVAADMISFGPDGTISFQHALYRDVTYSLLTQPQRTAAHTAAARWLEANRDPEDSLDLRAYHWTQADDRAHAMPLLARAARRSAELWPGHATIELVAAAERFAERGEQPVDALQRGEWNVLLGAAYRGAGELTKGDELILTGLAQMGLRVPISRSGKAGVLTREVCRQLVTRIAPARMIGRGSRNREQLTAAINAYRTLFIAAYQSDDPLQMGLVNTRILNLVEAAGLRAELSVQYGMAQLAAASIGARRTARHYRRLAGRAAAENRSGVNAAHATTYDAIYLIGEGRFVDAGRQLRTATSFYSRALAGSYIHDVVVSLVGYVEYFTGRFTEAMGSYRSVHDSGLRRGDPGMVAWGLNGQAMCCLARGHDEAVIELLARSRELPVERLGQIAWHTFDALASARLALVDRAWQAVEVAAPVLLAHNATVAVLQPEYSALAEAVLRLRDVSNGARRDRATRLGADVLRRFHRLQRRFPSAAPMYLIRSAEYRHAVGDDRSALRSYEHAARAGARLGMPLEAALGSLGAARLRNNTTRAAEARAALERLGVQAAPLTGAT